MLKVKKAAPKHYRTYLDFEVFKRVRTFLLNIACRENLTVAALKDIYDKTYKLGDFVIVLPQENIDWGSYGEMDKKNQLMLKNDRILKDDFFQKLDGRHLTAIIPNYFLSLFSLIHFIFFFFFLSGVTLMFHFFSSCLYFTI
jgi:hypothetical protein